MIKKSLRGIGQYLLAWFVGAVGLFVLGSAVRWLRKVDLLVVLFAVGLLGVAILATVATYLHVRRLAAEHALINARQLSDERLAIPVTREHDRDRLTIEYATGTAVNLPGDRLPIREPTTIEAAHDVSVRVTQGERPRIAV